MDKAGVSHPAIPRWTFTAADGVEMPLEEGTSAFITMNPGYIGARRPAAQLSRRMQPPCPQRTAPGVSQGSFGACELAAWQGLAQAHAPRPPSPSPPPAQAVLSCQRA